MISIPFATGCPEVADAFREVALVEVVGADPVFHEFVDELFHDPGAVVNPRKEHRLVPERDTGIGEFCESCPGRIRHLPRMVELRVHPERVVFF